MRSLKIMDFKIFDLGFVDFKKAWQFQKEIFTEVKNGYLTSALLVCRHYPVITLGRLGKKENILVSEYELKKREIQIYQIERGGDVTYHGPGQITVYPIFNLNYLKKDIHLFLRRLEDIVIRLLSDIGIMALRFPGLTGVWVGPSPQKIASVGIAIKNWITFHGLSINIKNNDLDNFSLIRPCGMDIKMTSLETVLDKDIELDTVKNNLIEKIKDIFNVNFFSPSRN
jgi:lipoate-protein ligase B